MKQTITIFTLLFLFVCHSFSQVQYATRLIEYTPAPGQFINKSPGLPKNAQSILNGAAAPGQMVSLGFWGGYIVLGFDQSIQNHPDNPYGVDFTVFGNPFLGSSEPGIVQVMKDENGNGKADDTWYELRGSDHFFSTTQRNYAITYTNPHGTKNVPWTDSNGQTGEVVYMNAFHSQEHYPMAAHFPHINQNNYTLRGTHLKSRTALGDVWVNYEFDYGYVDNKPIKRNVSKDIPDNPYTLNITEGCGGDAFDISWAVDKNNHPVTLDKIDFIKIYNGVTQNAGAIGEVSTEVCGVAVVKPNAAISGTTKTIICNHPENIGNYPVERRFKWYRNHTFQFEAYIINKGKKDAVQDIRWSSGNPSVASITNDGQLKGHTKGSATITCYSASSPSLTRSFDIVIQDGVPTAITDTKELELA
ncbi:MAG: Ig-like domain-containing protein, partial [Carboxylicivirga sp.]|nr:Ig-like domain-containing protein [Carboxylicivirga sp.]